jgi:hypothetical protein
MRGDPPGLRLPAAALRRRNLARTQRAKALKKTQSWPTITLEHPLGISNILPRPKAGTGRSVFVHDVASIIVPGSKKCGSFPIADAHITSKDFSHSELIQARLTSSSAQALNGSAVLDGIS